jgi:ACT domain-containing protein
MTAIPKILITIILTSIYFYSCSGQTKNKSEKKSDNKQNHSCKKITISDSINFGKKNNFLVEVTKLSNEENSTIQFYFKQKVGIKWNLVDSFNREITEVLEPNIEYLDYDFDGYNDLSFNSDLGMNGSNIMRTIILFKPNINKIKVIKNSTRFPNLRINLKRKFLISTIFSGSTENVFFIIKNDTIEKIAILNFDTYLDLLKYKNGKVISNKFITDVNCDRNTRFINFEPITIE